MSKFPKVLIVALCRVNEVDSYNNGLLLRNLFGTEWPRDRLAQIYSSGNTGDRGFFGHYYMLGSNERRFGRLFYRLKSEASVNQYQELTALQQSTSVVKRICSWLKKQTVRLLMESGLYELIFYPRISDELMNWVSEFKPDVIFAQGYNLTFTRLPILLKNKTSAKLAVLTTDDWPKYLYAGMHGEATALRWMVRPVVTRAANDFFKYADIPLAFGEPMAQEYSRRYGQPFLSINHSDDPARFAGCSMRFINNSGKKTIIAIGTFNDFRWPLLIDANEACAELSRNGHEVRLVVLSSAISREGKKALETAKFIEVFPDPGNDQLPSFLKGADALLLAESFDEGFVSAIELSVSSKAHLFMFSRRPIVVYAASKTGIAKYALSHGWAKVVSNRSTHNLATALLMVLNNRIVTEDLVARSDAVSMDYHSHVKNQSRFLNALAMIVNT